jgi:hypothetical protein
MTRGRKPKAPHLRLIQGTHRDDRHGIESEVREAVVTSAINFGPLSCPPRFKRLARAAWKQYIEPATWLDASREASAIAFCELWHEMRSAPTRYHANHVRQHFHGVMLEAWPGVGAVTIVARKESA